MSRRLPCCWQVPRSLASASALPISARWEASRHWRKATRQISRFYDAHLEPADLRLIQFLTLAALNEVSSTPINTLADRLDIERTAMGKIVGFWNPPAWLESTPRPPMAEAT